MTASQVRSEGQMSTWWREPQQLALYGCGIITLIAFISGYSGVPILVTNGLYLLAVLVGVYYPARKALIALRAMTPTIHLLMLIGSVGAMALGLWGEAAVLIFVYSLGDVLESYAVDKARGAIRSLMALVPTEALIRRNGCESICAVESIGVGEIVIVRPGERIPVDGTVVAGSSYVDQAAVTGEPVPVRCKPGSDVFAGTINQNGSLDVRVTKPASETMLSRIILQLRKHRRSGPRTSGSRIPSGSGILPLCSSLVCSWLPYHRSFSVPSGTRSFTGDLSSSWSRARVVLPFQSLSQWWERWQMPQSRERSSKAGSTLKRSTR